MRWTQPLCDSCWDKENPDRTAARVVAVASEPCCMCGEPTRGIYVRRDPSTVPFPAGEADLRIDDRYV